jgi:hypothetical protein
LLRPELAASHDFGADAWRPLAGQGVVDSRTPTGLAVHCAEGPGSEEPLVQPTARVPERRLHALSDTRAETVERNRKVVHAHL